MSGLARILRAKGYGVSGTDVCPSDLLESLARAGVRIRIGHAASNVPPDTGLVVRTAAVGDRNPEIEEANRRRLRVARYSEALGALMKEKIGIAVSGTHGKTTTSAMTAHILTKAGFDPSFLIGGLVNDLGGNAKLGYGAHFVAEACEYGASFHDLFAEVAVITAVEPDHLDFYGTFENLKKSFETFAGKLPAHGCLVANAEDVEAMSVVVNGARCPVWTFGVQVPALWTAKEIGEFRGRYEFTLVAEGRALGRVRLLVPGYHNVKNALAAAAAARAAGAAPKDIVKGLSTFTGVDRRFQVVGRAGGVTVITDYAHHPTKVRALLSTARKSYPGSRLCCVFQPHQGSRTRMLLEDFARAFVLADLTLVSEIYYVRDAAEERSLVSSRDLVARMKDFGLDARFVPSLDEMPSRLRAVLEPGDVLLCVGAGPIGDLPPRVMEMLEKERPGPAKRRAVLPGLPAAEPPSLPGPRVAEACHARG
ncbi:MAG: UDP-N-acetylmuramate--L-alanine ligase [Planctomycetes bacterium]|nr:UDP-N-acetylmuramate--L-alanine ligase [Planctomycetota bacterium]